MQRRKLIQEAMVRLADGERAAFSVLLDELWPVVLAFARRGLGHEQDAEDVAQEVFVRICSRISDFDRGRDAVAWAFGIANFEVLTQRRRRVRRRETFDGDSSMAGRSDPSATQEEMVIQRELEAALEEALGGLSDDDRQTLAMTAAQVGVPAATLRKRKQRALGRLRLIWRKIYGES